MKKIVLFGVLVSMIPVFVTSGSLLNLFVMVLYATLLGQSWNILAGFGGQFSFGHAVFFGTGAYASAVLQAKFGWNAWAALPAAIALGAAAGAFIGALSFRYGLRGSYFALVTLAFAEVFRVLANNLPFTGMGVGLMLKLEPGALNFQLERAGFLYVILAFVVVALLISHWLKHSRYGAWLQAVRDNEAAAAALGVNVFRVKLGAIMLSAALMAAGGVFYVQYFQYIDPSIAYGPAVSIEALLGPIVGGLGSVWGPVLGALVLHLLGESTRGLVENAPGVNLIVYGAVLVAMISFLPRGLAGLKR
ncbi:MAG TPA: branched-chain amino acid ABC transporter permease [Burkholderiales bacterium]|nr:branched-chain amino acid ABC transporter permease [Burkholderiales bacterium]